MQCLGLDWSKVVTLYLLFIMNCLAMLYIKLQQQFSVRYMKNNVGEPILLNFYDAFYTEKMTA